MKPTYKNNPRTSELTRLSLHDIAKNYVNKPGSIWLDSTLTFEDRGKNSFLAFEPIAQISQIGNGISIKSQKKELNLILTKLSRMEQS